MNKHFPVLRLKSHLLAKELNILVAVLTACMKEGQTGKKSQVTRKLNTYTSTGTKTTTELLVHKTVHLLITTDYCEKIRNHGETLEQGIH